MFSLVVMEDVRGNDTEEVVELDSRSTRSSTPDPKFEPVSVTTDPLPRSKVTGRPKYMHCKRPRVTKGITVGSDLEFLKTIGHHLVNKDNQRKVKNEESLFGELISSQLRKLPNQERLTIKMEINNIIFTRLLKNSSQDGTNSGYVAARYPETANRAYPERHKITPPYPHYHLRLVSELGNGDRAETFPPGYFFQQHRHDVV